MDNKNYKRLLYKSNVSIRNKDFVFEVYNEDITNDDILSCYIYDKELKHSMHRQTFKFNEQSIKLVALLKPHISKEDMRITEVEVYKFIELDMRKQFILQYLAPAHR